MTATASLLGWRMLRPGLYARNDVVIERIHPDPSWRWRLCVPSRRMTLHRRFSDAVEEAEIPDHDATFDAEVELILAESHLREALDELDSWRRAEATRRAEAGLL